MGLYVMDALTGEQKYFLQIPAAYVAGNRGLGGVVGVRDINRRLVAAYAGDALGNLWRFDLRANGNTPKVSYGKPLFTSPTAQPMYAAPAWQVHPGDGGKTCPKSGVLQCGAIVVVGTGILLEDSDVTSSLTNSLYGIWDPTPVGGNDVAGFQTATGTDLVQQTMDLAQKETYDSKDFYKISENEVKWQDGKRGWYLNLGVIPVPGVAAGGERVIGDAANLGSSVVLTTTFIKNTSITLESCTSSGLSNAIYILDALTGKNKMSFDVNGDHRPEAYSVVFIADGGYTRGNVISKADGGMGDTDNAGKSNEASPKMEVKDKCTGAKGWETGVGGSVEIFDGCINKNWTRTWRAIVSPPFF